MALGPDGLIDGFKKGSALLRPHHQLARPWCAGAAGLRGEGHPRARRAGERRAGGRQVAQARDLGRRRQAIFDKYKPVLDAIGDAAHYIGPIGAGSVAKLVHNCAGYAIQTALAEVFTMGVKGGVEPLALWEAVRSGAGGRSRTFDGLADQFLLGTYDPPSFALQLAHKDMWLATELGRELGVPMRARQPGLAEMTEALNRGWENRDSRSPMLLQLERCGLKVEVDPKRIQEVLERDPPFGGLDPKRG